MSPATPSRDPTQILETCLLRLQAGEPLETVLADYPAITAELRDELETVLKIWSTRGSDTVPLRAMQRSRARLMTVAHQLKTVPRPPWWKVWPLFIRGWLRRAASWRLAFIGLLLVAAILLAGFTAAWSLPGEPLFPAKLAIERFGLLFIGSPAARLEREEIYDLRRTEEVKTLIAQQRGGQVECTGYLTRADTGSWTLDGIALAFPAGSETRLQDLENQLVTLRASLSPQGEAAVADIQPRHYELAGRITASEPARIALDGVWLDLGQAPLPQAAFSPGQVVRANVTRRRDGSLFALKVEVLGP